MAKGPDKTPAGFPLSRGKNGELLKMAKSATRASKGKLRVAAHEEDTSESTAPDAATFLKINGRRLGRDLELYNFMGEEVIGWEQTLPMILEEVILPLRRTLPESYVAAGRRLRRMGDAVYSGETRQKWDDLFEEVPQGRR